MQTVQTAFSLVTFSALQREGAVIAYKWFNELAFRIINTRDDLYATGEGLRLLVRQPKL